MIKVWMVWLVFHDMASRLFPFVLALLLIALVVPGVPFGTVFSCYSFFISFAIMDTLLGFGLGFFDPGSQIGFEILENRGLFRSLESDEGYFNPLRRVRATTWWMKLCAELGVRLGNKAQYHAEAVCVKHYKRHQESWDNAFLDFGKHEASRFERFCIRFVAGRERMRRVETFGYLDTLKIAEELEQL